MANDNPIVLVHGGAHRAACWNLLIRELEASGRQAVAVDLPGYGRDSTIDPTPRTLADGIEATAEAIARLGGPVMLVGHSLGGMTISGAAEHITHAIDHLVYLSAVVPRDGESAESMAATDGMKASAGTFVLNDGERIGFRPEMAREIFYNDCPDDIVAAATEALVSTDLGYLTTPVSLSPARFGKIRKSYVICTRDQAITPEMQRLFTRVHPGVAVHEIVAGHSPFLSKPSELATLIANL